MMQPSYITDSRNTDQPQYIHPLFLTVYHQRESGDMNMDGI